MARARKKLTAREVAALSTPGLHSDGNRLYLAIDGQSRKRWIFRYQTKGRQRDLGLGIPLDVSLADARAKAEGANALLRQGVDPIDQKKQVAIALVVPTFGQYVEEFLATKESGWSNPKHRAQWRATLATYATPLNALPLDKIATADVLKVLQPIWAEKPETASRLRGRIEAVLDAAKAAGHRVGENPAAWAGNLKHLLPKRQASQEHHVAVPYADVPAFTKRLREQAGLGALALEFTILTAARSGETRGATWSELDLEAKIWTIPAVRMKASREHRVPLSDRAIEILKEVKPLANGEAGLVFPGLRHGKPLSDMSLTAVLRRMKVNSTCHGFRSTFRDWAGDHTVFQREIVEAALAHVVGDKAEQAYRRGDALQKRRALMAAWASYLDAVPANVTALKQAG
ncbi:integrase [Beijerinckiaceae bacterium]|nr:integrase [Beijerinckiaceae bacterium]